MAFNRNLQQLSHIAAKETRMILGLMSGTSVDGLDIALCRFRGNGPTTQMELIDFETIAYAPDFRAEIKTIFSKKQIDFEKLCLLNPWVATQQSALILAFLKKRGIEAAEIDLIASHGQTVYHAPKALHQQTKFGNATLQIGDGDHMAVVTGIITISDFRQKHIAAGGEGAPLAVYGDYLIFSKAGEDRIMLNMGGIANFTYLPGNLHAHEVFCTDTGPGNTLMDAWIHEHFPDQYFDKDGRLASEGNIHAALLAALKDHPFFEQPFPKTTGPELFNLAYLNAAQQKSNTTDLSIADVMATLNRFTAETIAESVLKLDVAHAGAHLYASGGGMHNIVLMQHLRDLLPKLSFHRTENLGVHPDAKEAVLFAVLANECIAGGNVSFGDRPGVPNITMGKISFPW